MRYALSAFRYGPGFLANLVLTRLLAPEALAVFHRSTALRIGHPFLARTGYEKPRWMMRRL